MNRQRQRSPKHLDMIRGLPCVVCLRENETEACHLRASDSRYGKVNPGLGRKADDKWTTPLCGDHHREQHSMNELRFWSSHGINPFQLALCLWGATGSHEIMERIVRETAQGEQCYA